MNTQQMEMIGCEANWSRNGSYDAIVMGSVSELGVCMSK